MASSRVDQQPELGRAHLCDRCRVLEDIELLRTGIDRPCPGLGGESNGYNTRYFLIVSWQHLDIHKLSVSRCEFCRLISSEISLGTSNWQPRPTKISVRILGRAVSGRLPTFSGPRRSESWVIHSFEIRLSETPDDVGTYHDSKVLILSDEG